MTKIKEPPAYDVSKWQGRPLWANVRPRPSLVICKATEADDGTDRTFLWNFDQLQQNGIPPGAYHFHRKAVSPIRQALHFVEIVQPVIKPADFLALDVEEGGETAAQLISWLDTVEHWLPKNPILIYSTKLLLEAISCTTLQARRFKQYHTWIAGYPEYPDQFDHIPSWYVPDPERWGKPWLWQYAEGSVTGIQGSKIDPNWIDPELFTQLPAVPVEPTQLQLKVAVQFPS